ncbi:MAG: hypothetical protein R6V56_02215 [Lentisphaeria bacterium]
MAKIHFPFFSLCAPALVTCALYAQEPNLPQGLGLDSDQKNTSKAEPALPSGLGRNNRESRKTEAQAPELPSGLNSGSTTGDSNQTAKPEIPPEQGRLLHVLTSNELTGFAEARVGTRTQPDPYHDDMSVGELRLQVDASRPIGTAYINLKADLLYDYEYKEHDIDLEEGQGWLDLREANILFTPLHFMDIKAGRQVLTWGTGDLIFINDLFPKDWNSFFIGRDDEYLKAPSDAVKVSVFAEQLPSLDLIYTPRFDSDRYVDGSRLSFYNSLAGSKVGEDNVVDVDKLEDWFADHEIAARLYKNVAGYELAAYYYRGFWKSPAGINPATQEFTFPKLSVYGASARGTIFNGIGHLETGYYRSRDDEGGANPFADNSEIRLLVGYEQELGTNLTGTFQYYVEHMMDHDEYLDSLSSATPARDEARHTVTMRLRKELFQDDLILSIFTRYSLTDNDAYLRPKINYTVNDNLEVELGGNIFMGHDESTFLAQFEKNTSVHAAIRYNY